MTYYTVCPTCGYKLLKAGEGSNIEIFCPKCGDKMTIEIKDGKIVVQRVLSNKAELHNFDLPTEKELSLRKLTKELSVLFSEGCNGKLNSFFILRHFLIFTCLFNDK